MSDHPDLDIPGFRKRLLTLKQDIETLEAETQEGRQPVNLTRRKSVDYHVWMPCRGRPWHWPWSNGAKLNFSVLMRRYIELMRAILDIVFPVTKKSR